MKKTFISLLVFCIFLITGCANINGNIGYQPPLIPVTVSVDMDGVVGVSWGGSLQTPIGIFSTNIGVEANRDSTEKRQIAPPQKGKSLI